MKITIYSLAATGDGISGGDRIWIEFALRWAKKHIVTVVTSPSGIRMFNNFHRTSNIRFITSPQSRYFLLGYIKKIVFGISIAKKLSDDQPGVIYAASEFLPDLLPSIVQKCLSKKICLVCSWFQTAPNPLRGFSYKSHAVSARNRKRAFVYWLAQKISKPLVNMLGNLVLVNNEAEKIQFPSKQTVVVIGAIDTDHIRQFMRSEKASSKQFTGVFQGRFHPQKGVIELIEIIRYVVRGQPKAKFVLIGDGPLMPEIKKIIKKNSLQKNIKITGYLFDGKEKYNYFLRSKMVLHPSLYDSGGMASAEAMAFGLPCVAYNLDSYKSYYPGILELVKYGDKSLFANKILYLIKNEQHRLVRGKKAQRFILKNFSWNNRAEEILSSIIEYAKFK